MVDISDYNTDGVEPRVAFEPLAPGWYPMWATESEIKPTKAGTGEYLKVRLDVFEGEFEKRVVYHNFNIKNPNAQAVEIAYRDLAGWKLACKKPQATTSEELHQIPMWVKLKISKAREGYEPGNEVVEFKAYEAGAPAAPAKPAASATPVAKATTPPWAKK